MRDPLSKAVTGLAPSGIRRFFDLANTMEDVISLGVGEPDFDTPWHIREEGIYSLEKGRTFYTSNSGLMELREAIGEYLARRFDLSYSAGEIFITVGGSEAIDIACRVMLDPGDEVIIPEPCYVSYLPCVILAGGTPVRLPLSAEDQFKLTPEKLESAITERTKLVVLPFPNNPTGAVMSGPELKKIAELVEKHDLFVLSDEIYAELTYGERHVSFASLPGMKERTVLINGFSKAFAMTGWRLGYAAAPENILKQMIKVHQYVIMCAPTTSQYAAIEAMRNGDKDVEFMRESYDERRRFLVHELNEMGLPCFEPRGAFYVFPSIKSTGLTSEEFATKLLESQHVAVVPGTAFGDCGEGFLRISYAYSIENLKNALEKIKIFVDSLR
ncbi:MAG: aminotransferase class I/II-fold pyridoxal phosphate-dependent enzyme [Eubacterium sp.]|nr:aminotransferase class I/II-fold pyridoxal phosphate-dependent enzyme [Eubacterium sp.]